MDLLTLPRAAFTAYLGAVKWPIDTGLKVAGRDAGPTALTVDRLDGTIRTVVGGLLRDDVLQRDGVRRLTAVDERQRAQRLRAEAELRRERADQELDQGREQAERQRRTAAERAERTRRAAEERKAARKRKAEQAERERKAANERAEATVEATIDDAAKRERLEILEQQAAALDTREEALTTRDEAQRLADAAAQAKAARKSG